MAPQLNTELPALEEVAAQRTAGTTAIPPPTANAAPATPTAASAVAPSTPPSTPPPSVDDDEVKSSPTSTTPAAPAAKQMDFKAAAKKAVEGRTWKPGDHSAVYCRDHLSKHGCHREKCKFSHKKPPKGQVFERTKQQVIVSPLHSYFARDNDPLTARYIIALKAVSAMSDTVKEEERAFFTMIGLFEAPQPPPGKENYTLSFECPFDCKYRAATLGDFKAHDCRKQPGNGQHSPLGDLLSREAFRHCARYRIASNSTKPPAPRRERKLPNKQPTISSASSKSEVLAHYRNGVSKNSGVFWATQVSDLLGQSSDFDKLRRSPRALRKFTAATIAALAPYRVMFDEDGDRDENLAAFIDHLKKMPAHRVSKSALEDFEKQPPTDKELNRLLEDPAAVRARFMPDLGCYSVRIPADADRDETYSAVLAMLKGLPDSRICKTALDKFEKEPTSDGELNRLASDPKAVRDRFMPPVFGANATSSEFPGAAWGAEMKERGDVSRALEELAATDSGSFEYEGCVNKCGGLFWKLGELEKQFPDKCRSWIEKDKAHFVLAAGASTTAVGAAMVVDCPLPANRGARPTASSP